MINSSEGSDILVFNATFVMSVFACLLFDSTKIGENPDMSKCFEDFVSQALGFLTRNYAAELRFMRINIYFHEEELELLTICCQSTVSRCRLEAHIKSLNTMC